MARHLLQDGSDPGRRTAAYYIGAGIMREHILTTSVLSMIGSAAEWCILHGRDGRALTLCRGSGGVHHA